MREDALDRVSKRLVLSFEIEAPHVVAIEKTALDGRCADEGLDGPPEIEGVDVIAKRARISPLRVWRASS
jgi:hypothetical protein